MFIFFACAAVHGEFRKETNQKGELADASL
jgi:hypothetical protein